MKGWRVLLVTFDLADTVPGDRRYRDADEAMSGHGTLFKPVKQIRFLLTRRTSQVVRESIEQRTGKITLMIAPFTKAYQLRVRGRTKRAEMERFVDAVRAVGLDVSGFEDF